MDVAAVPPPKVTLPPVAAGDLELF